jgi:type IV pilus assembly protein PilB
MAERLGDILIRRRIIDSGQLDAALTEQKETNKFLGEIMVTRGYVSERQLLEILAEQFETRYVSLSQVQINPMVTRIVPKALVYEHQFMPIAVQNAIILIAISNPLDMWPMSNLQKNIDVTEVRFVLAEKADIRSTIEKFYGPEAG